MSRARVRYDRVAALLVALFLAVPVARAASGTAVQARPSHGTAQVVVVRPGDTLWAIAERLGEPGADPRAQIDAIAQLNGIDSGAIFPGQRLQVP